MKVIARKLTNAEDLAYVGGFMSRPMMHILKSGPPSPNLKPLNSFSFINTVTKFVHLVRTRDLGAAYGRAGQTFNGRLHHNFVVLYEQYQASLQSVRGSNPGGLGSTPAFIIYLINCFFSHLLFFLTCFFFLLACGRKNEKLKLNCANSKSAKALS